LGIPDLAPQLAAYYYNANRRHHQGRLEGVFNIKNVPEPVKRALVQAFDGIISKQIEPYPWLMDTCIGEWHYRRGIKYRSVTEMVHNLVDVVSKNGSFLLSIPMRGDGTIDQEEVKFLQAMGSWMAVNGEAIYGTRPWKVFGEDKVRFTRKGHVLYAFLLGVPTATVRIMSLGTSAKLEEKPVSALTLLGSEDRIEWRQEADALRIAPSAKPPSEHAIAYRIRFAE
jgi:alpha-L-fucosidase